MSIVNMLNNPKLEVSPEAPYDPLQAFVRENHIALGGADTGELKGLNFAIKDVWKVLGSTCGNGHPLWLQTHAPDDFTASIVIRLLQAGADMVGKTICDELCFSISGENWNYGSPLNPHDPRRFTGGSSSGSGAATAGGLVDFALGSDCLGSVRVPASYNGVLGMRPSYQRVPGDGEAPYCQSMDVVGFMGTTPQTFKRVASVILGEDETPVQFKKLLIAKDCFAAINQDVADTLRPAVAHTASALASVEAVVVSPDGLDKWSDIFRIIQGYEVWESYGGWVRKYHPRLSRGPKERLEWASTITLTQYKEAKELRKLIIERIQNLITPDAVLCLPTAASIAPLRSTPLEELNATRQQSAYLLCISPLTSIPQVTLPLVKQHEMPLGLSLMAAKGSDLNLAHLSADLVATF